MRRRGEVFVLATVLLVCGTAAAADITIEARPVTHPVTVEPDRAPGDSVNLVLDDGSVDNNIGIGGNTEFVFLNRFTPAEFPLEITQVDVFFAGGTTALNVGDPFDVYLWENTSGNADPAVGATYIGAGTGNTIAALDDWTTVTLSTPLQFNGPGGDIVVAVVHRLIPGSAVFPAALDTTATQGRSWAGWYTTAEVPDPPTLPPDDTWGTIDSFGFAGNWLVRASGTVLPVELMSFAVE